MHIVMYISRPFYQRGQVDLYGKLYRAKSEKTTFNKLQSQLFEIFCGLQREITVINRTFEKTSWPSG